MKCYTHTGKYRKICSHAVKHASTVNRPIRHWARMTKEKEEQEKEKEKEKEEEEEKDNDEEEKQKDKDKEE